MPFYIGKGVGSRRFDHLRCDDESEKSQRIRAIRSEGFDVLVSVLVDNLTEDQALKLEAELIAAFGTVDTGGILLNRVMPSGLGAKSRPELNIPSGVKEKAQLGLALLKEAVLELARTNPNGITNAETASVLGLRSDYGGGSKDYLSYSILGLLMRDGKVQRVGRTRRHVATVK
jgi:hypothetical protein